MKCQKCGSSIHRITMYDGPNMGGHKITCAECGHVIERQEYRRDDDGETGKLSYVRK